MTEQVVTITKEEYDQLQAANDLLCRVFGDHGYMYYEVLYPEWLKATGFGIDEDDDGETDEEDDVEDLPFLPLPEPKQ